ncbi:unnamed protein product [Auanema sp. JU1783]|nr:unnamed protein product [Auanema sp. JU1783]
MASLTIRAGLNASTRLPTSSLLIIGHNRHIKAFSYDELKPKIGECVSEAQWKHAVEILPNSGSLPLYFNQARIASISDKLSRGNSPANPIEIFKEVKSSSSLKGSETMNIVLLADYEHVLASVAAISRSFPTYCRKTGKSEDNISSIEVEVVVTNGKALTENDVSFLSALSHAIREAGRLIDAPANELTTDALVDEAKVVAASLGLTPTIIQGEELLNQGFGGIYHVGKAGPTPPAFVVLSHKPAGATQTYALVGKGVVYDTGGMQIKGKTGMPNMKRDMGGAAGFLHAFATLVKAGFKQNLHVCLCIVENHVSPIANKPDDIIRMLSGKTVEINNTDAEGRLILADGVYYAKHTLGADTIIDMATLTGAQSYLTGKLHGAVLTNSEDWELKALQAGKRSGDMLGPMLFCPEVHFPDLKSKLADMKNSNLGKMNGPPSAVAGLFIGAHIEFGEGLNWLHLDIAAPAECEDRGTGYGPTLMSALLGNDTNVPLLHH